MADANGSSEGPPSAGVAHINKYGQNHFNGYLSCSWRPDKGRILHCTREFELGAVILRESPLHVVQESDASQAFLKLKKLCATQADDFDYEPLWYWCAIQSLTKEQLKGGKCSGMTGTDAETQHNLLLLHHEDVTEPSRAATVLKEEVCGAFCDAIILERLIQIWVLNCFEYSDDPQGYSTYFFSSFMSHSCFPNAVWHYDGDDHVLRARRKISVGDEVCISYLPEDALLQAIPSRRWELHETKRFWCNCERCLPTDKKDFSRGFRCPACSTGTIFANAPKAGPAKSAAFLASELVGATCDSCGHKLKKDAADTLGKSEDALKKEVDRLGAMSPSTLKEVKDVAKDIELRIGDCFVQHVLADLCWEKLAEFYEGKSAGEQRRLLELRRVFHQGAYPGLSGAHAWTLEAYADAMAKGPKALKTATDKQAKADPQAAGKLFTEALEILTLMFGKEHEYVTQVEQKRSKLPK